MNSKALLFRLTTILLILIIGQNVLVGQSGIITAPLGVQQISSSYVDTAITDDPVFIFCSPDSNGDSIMGQLSIIGSYANCTYLWGIYDPDPSSLTYQQFVPFLPGPIPTGPSSNTTDLES